MSSRILSIVAALALSGPLSAHDLYLMPNSFTSQKGSVLIVSLNNGDSFPESEASPVPERVKDMEAISETGTVPVEHLRVVGKALQGEVTIQSSGSVILTARTVPYAFALSADEFRAYLTEEGLDQVLKWRTEHQQQAARARERYRKFSKALISNGNGALLTKPVGHELEFVPLKDPTELKAGDEMTAQVLFHGAPQPDLQVEASWAGAGAAKTFIVGRTDKSGRITAKLISAGRWRFHTVLMERCAEPQVADWESYWASLTFEIP